MLPYKDPSERGRKRRFCSQLCKQRGRAKRLRRLNPVVFRQSLCKTCGTVLSPRPSNERGRKRLFCSPVCLRRYKAATVLFSRECDFCGKRFEYQGNRQARRFCSSHCCTRAHQRMRSDRKRLTSSDVNIDLIPLPKLVKRDAGRCYHCGKQVDVTKRYPHPDSPTRDHFVPLAKGGLHTWSNLVLSCWSCNIRKGASMPRQGPQGLLFPA